MGTLGYVHRLCLPHMAPSHDRPRIYDSIRQNLTGSGEQCEYSLEIPQQWNMSWAGLGWSSLDGGLKDPLFWQDGMPVLYEQVGMSWVLQYVAWYLIFEESVPRSRVCDCVIKEISGNWSGMNWFSFSLLQRRILDIP